jgi:hypothetical protein
MGNARWLAASWLQVRDGNVDATSRDSLLNVANTCDGGGAAYASSQTSAGATVICSLRFVWDLAALYDPSLSTVKAARIRKCY